MGSIIERSPRGWKPLKNPRFVPQPEPPLKNLKNNFRLSFEICDEDGIGNLTMCPVCDIFCDFWKLSDSCFLSKVTYLFDNDSTVFFAIFMSFWGRLSLKRFRPICLTMLVNVWLKDT